QHIPISFFFTPPSTTYFYTLSLHDALPILLHFFIKQTCISEFRKLGLSYYPISKGLIAYQTLSDWLSIRVLDSAIAHFLLNAERDRKSTRLNSSHLGISYAVFCLKKKKKQE